jgi:hypothetical protein
MNEKMQTTQVLEFARLMQTEYRPEIEKLEARTGLDELGLCVETLEPILQRVFEAGVALASGRRQEEPELAEWRRIKRLFREEYRCRSSPGNVGYPRHSHAKAGIWDSDNGKLAGHECAACAAQKSALLDAIPAPEQGEAKDTFLNGDPRAKDTMDEAMRDVLSPTCVNKPESAPSEEKHQHLLDCIEARLGSYRSFTSQYPSAVSRMQGEVAREIYDLVAVALCATLAERKRERKALEDIADHDKLTHWCTGCKMAVGRDHKHWSLCIPIGEAREADDFVEMVDKARDAIGGKDE